MPRRDEEDEYYEDEEPRRSRRSRDDEDEPRSSRSLRRSKKRDDDEDEDEPRSRRRSRSRDDDEDEEDEAPRGRRRARDDDDEGEDDEPRGRRRRSRDDDEDDEPRGRRRRRSRDDEDEDDDEEDEKPRRGRKAKGAESDLRRGWSAGQAAMDSTSDFAKALRLEESVQIVKFLEDEPYASYARHWVETGTGKERTNRAYTCLRSVNKPCPLCDDVPDRPQSVSAFNVALLGDDGEVVIRTWDVGVRLFGTLKSFGTDPKIGPLTKGYYAVSKRGTGRNTSNTVLPIKASMLEEDYDMDEPTAKQLDALELYDTSVIEIPSRSDLQKLADDLADGADYR